MSDVLARIDNTLSDLCPCGAQPSPGSPYCGYDCEPNHISRDTDTRTAGQLVTPMRWRPDLVTAADDRHLTLIGSGRETGYTGRHNATTYEVAGQPNTWHLRLDDGHRYVGRDLPDVGTPDGPIGSELVARARDMWQRLEQELTDPRQQVHGDPWADAMPPTIGTVWVAPLGTDPSDRSAWRNVGTTSDQWNNAAPRGHSDVEEHWYWHEQPPSPQPRPVAATVTIRFDDGSEQEIALRGGGELAVTTETHHDVEDVDLFPRTIRRPGPNRYRIALDTTYNPGSTPDGVHWTVTNRPAAEPSDPQRNDSGH